MPRPHNNPYLLAFKKQGKMWAKKYKSAVLPTEYPKLTRKVTRMQLQESSCLLCGKQRVSHSTRSAERDPSVLACKVVVWQNGMLAAVLSPIDSKTCDYQTFVSAIYCNQTCSLGFTVSRALFVYHSDHMAAQAWQHDHMTK